MDQISNMKRNKYHNETNKGICSPLKINGQTERRYKLINAFGCTIALENKTSIWIF